jgi:hypothetical protein
MERFKELYIELEAGRLSCEGAAMILGCSTRHFLRLRSRYDEDGLAGLKDRRVGRVSCQRAADAEVEEITSAFFCKQEGTNSSLRGIHETIAKHGLFCSFYTDRGSHYFYTPEAGGKVDKSRLTEVGRALKHLRIIHIAAYSPEARGRSERMFATLQGRLVSELKLAGITDMKVANRYLQDVYLPRHNAQFTVTPELEASAFVDAKGIDIANVLCIQEDRVVGSDNTVSYKKMTLQIPPSPFRHHYVKTHVRVHHYPDDSMAIFHGPREIGRYLAGGELHGEVKIEKREAIPLRPGSGYASASPPQTGLAL